jgi:leucyl aminopeptidase
MPPTTPRDRAAEIVTAIGELSGGPRRVTVVAGTGGDRHLRFVHAEDVEPDAPGWLSFTGARGQLTVDGDVLLVGLGSREAASVESARHAARLAGRELVGSVAVSFPPDADGLVAALVDGLVSGERGNGPVQLLVAPDALAAAERGLLAAAAVRLAGLLVSAPANLLTPEQAARWAQELAGSAGLTCTVYGPDQVAEQGFGGLQAIGAGSVAGPHLVRLAYPVDPAAPTVALVGKGITFDSGGLSLKSPAAQQTMRLDVAGAATVLAVMGALRRSGCRVNVIAVLPFAENLPGPGSVRPGDVVTAWNGTQIQVLDTDFEGRVILADALSLAAADGPELLVDLATLTYQAEIALGPEIAAVLARDDAAATLLLDAARHAGEPMWQLPWAPRYRDQVVTASGVRNHPLHDTGRALTAALFLGEFVPVSVPWVHCDMTGPAWSGDASADGGTGFGARTLLQLLSTFGSAG